MRPRLIFTLLSMMIATVGAALSVGILLSRSTTFSSRDVLYTVMTVALTAMVASYLVLIGRFFSRNPISLTISMLGFPGAGKTVYLTTLFDQLQRREEAGVRVRFTPYGRETIEAVTTNLNLLSSGTWLLPTPPGSVFPYRANATIGVGLFQRKFKIEIADWAGEKMAELNPSEPAWLHKTDYFKFVIQSDAVILALDAGSVWKSDRATREKIQNAYVAAFQVLAEEKGATERQQLRAPVALVFLKVDLCPPDKPVDELNHLVDRLISVCEARCQHFKVFYVSAVGGVQEDGRPPEEISPKGVVEPLIWILARSAVGLPV